MGYFRILAVIPGFFLSALFLMLLWRAISPQFGIATISYKGDAGYDYPVDCSRSSGCRRPGTSSLEPLNQMDSLGLTLSGIPATSRNTSSAVCASI